MAYENILTSLNNGIFTVTINRPDKLNALNAKTIVEVGEAIKEVVANPEIKGAILTGSGQKAFIAGADISEFFDFSIAEGTALSAAGHAIFNSVENCPKPVIAAVNGFALGGGCELAMACHLRIAADNAKFGQPEVNLGLTPGYAGTQRLVQLVGKSKALELLMTADMINAEEAHRLGLVSYVTTQEGLIPKCLEILEKIKTKSPVAIKGVINCVNAYYTEGVDGFKTEITEFGKCFGTEDFKEGTSAFLEKRKANFSGK
jgi:enoyl-CoA hydratase